MKKIILILMLFVFSSFVYATPSEDRTDYYLWNGTYLFDGFDKLDTSLDGTVPNVNDGVTEHLWNYKFAEPTYVNNITAFKGNLSIFLDSSVWATIFRPVNNASFGGIVYFGWWEDGDTSAYRIPMRVHSSGANIVWIMHKNSVSNTHYVYRDGGTTAVCDENSITRTDSQYNFGYYNWTGGNIYGYVEEQLCHIWVGVTGLDDFGAYIDASEVSTLYWVGAFVTNNGTIPQAPEGEAEPVLSLVLRNLTNTTISTLTEDDIYKIAANYSNTTASIPNGICHFDASNITTHFHNEATENNTLNLSTDFETLNFTKSDSFIKDSYKFRVCRGSIPSSIDVTINDIIHSSSDSFTIPQCSTGFFHEVNINTTDFLNDSIINMTITCPDCSANPNSFQTIIVNGDNRLEYNRESSFLTENLTYDGELYVFEENLFIADMDVTINLTCNTSTSSNTFNIIDKPLTINLISINDIGYTSGMIVEANDSYIILSDTFGDIITFFNLSVSFFNGTPISHTSNEFINISNSLLVGDGIYNISIIATDDDGNTTTLEDFFIVNDSVSPTFIWTFPSDSDNSKIESNSTTALSVRISDINLFAYECLIKDVNNNLRFNFSATGLTSTSVNVVEPFAPDLLGNWTVSCTASDDHTDIKFVQPKIKKELDESKITFDILKEDKLSKKIRKIKKNVTIEYIGAYILRDITTEAKKDKTSFTFQYDLTGYNALTIEHIYRLTCDELYYIPEERSGYPAHFVCWDSVTWVDFASVDLIDYEVYSCGVNCWEIVTLSHTNESIEFNSIGGLNQITEEHIFEVVAVADEGEFLKFLECPRDSVAGVMLFGLIFGIIASIYAALKIWVKLPILTIMYLFAVGFIYGMSLIGCSIIIGLMFIAVAWLMALAEAFFTVK